MVQGQLMKRQKDLEKIEQFETTLPQQLEKMKERYLFFFYKKKRFNEMKEEIKNFDDVDNIKKNMIERRQRLANETSELSTHTRNLQSENQGVQSELNQKKDK
jgi:hypothetical protein